MNKIMGLCAGRHEMPAEVEEYVFGEIKNPTNTLGLLDRAAANIGYCDHLTLYVTGLTVALGAVIRYCVLEGIGLTLMHYDRETDSYFPQTIL